MFTYFILIVAGLLYSCTFAFAKGVVTYRQFQRLNTPQNESAGDSWINFSYQKDKSHKGNYQSFYELHGRFFAGTNQGAFSVPEAYFERKRNKTEMVFGRKVLNWNPQEEIWGLGEFNGLRGFSLLEEEREGLTGIYIDRKSKNVRVSAFASYLYIPQLNPNYKIKDGKVTSASEWSKLPQDSVDYQEASVPITYALDMPRISEIVLQPTFGARAAYEWKTGSVSAYGIHKPEPNARINATGFYDNDEETASVRAKPFANHHRIVGGNVQQTFGTTNVMLGYFRIMPERGTDPTFEFEPLKIEPSYSDDSYGTAQVDVRSGYFRGSFGYIKLIERTNSDESIFAKVPKWHNAVVFRGSYDVNDYLSFNTDLKYDLTKQDKVLQGETAFHLLKRKARIVLGFEILEAPQDDSFWAPFRSNDSLYTNFSYIF